jgi:hypothetical protein
MSIAICKYSDGAKVVRAVLLRHHVTGSKQPLRICGKKACLILSLSHTPTHVGASGTRSAPFF